MASPGQWELFRARERLTAALLVRSISTLVSVITFLIFLDTFPPVLALELRQLESCSLYLLLSHNYIQLGPALGTSQDVMVLLQLIRGGSSLLSLQSKYPSQTFSLGIHRLPTVSFWEPGARHSWSVSCFCR